MVGLSGALSLKQTVNLTISCNIMATDATGDGRPGCRGNTRRDGPAGRWSWTTVLGCLVVSAVSRVASGDGECVGNASVQNFLFRIRQNSV